METYVRATSKNEDAVSVVTVTVTVDKTGLTLNSSLLQCSLLIHFVFIDVSDTGKILFFIS